jgi:DNA-directed RNA polymerase subunit RPC12/RpoP
MKTLEAAEEQSQEPCAYCGARPTQAVQGGEYTIFLCAACMAALSWTEESEK